MSSSVVVTLHDDALFRDPKMTDDFSKQVDELFKELESWNWDEPGVLEKATEHITELEKKARQHADSMSGSRLVCKLLTVYKNSCNWLGINEWILTFSKRKGQLKRVIVDMIHLCMEWAMTMDNKEIKRPLIQTLLLVTNGKMFLEVEHARLVLLEVRMLEEEKNYEKAALLLQDVQVDMLETMDTREKFLYILDQIRLVLMRDDYIRCHLISKKINPKHLNDDNLQDIKIQYYTYLIQLHKHEKDYLAIAEDYWKCFETPCVNEGDWTEYFSCYVIYLSMAPLSKVILNRIKTLCETEVKRLEKIPPINSLAHDLLSTELVDWPLPYEDELKKISVFSSDALDENWTIFFSRRLQQNILVLSKYYSRMRLSSLSTMLNISTKQAEEVISELVYTDQLYARIDRPCGIVTFTTPKTHAEKLDQWAANISSLLNLVQETTHLINNERMVKTALDKRRELNEAA